MERRDTSVFRRADCERRERQRQLKNDESSRSFSAASSRRPGEHTRVSTRRCRAVWRPPSTFGP